MKLPSVSPRHPATILAVAVLAIIVALPVLAASPSPSGGGAPSGPGPEPKASRAPKVPTAAKASEAPEVQVTIRGEVRSTTDAEGQPDFTIAANGKTLHLDAGPSWFFGTKHPLLPFVGKTVTIVGEQSGDEVDVVSVDGTAVRAPGKPPWAGGWKTVGKIHPGWSQAKADRQAAKVKARAACAAAVPCKTKVAEPDESAEPSEAPEGG